MTTAPLPRLTREPNVVPMIDVLLVLLIIFMIASASQRRALDLQLPQQSSGGASGPSLVLTVHPGPPYALNGAVIAANGSPSPNAAWYASHDLASLKCRKRWSACCV